jgi:hypothetical protein
MISPDNFIAFKNVTTPSSNGTVYESYSPFLQNVIWLDAINTYIAGAISNVPFFLSAIAIIVLMFVGFGKFQDFRTKRVQLYQHVQGLLLIRLILKSKTSTQLVSADVSSLLAEEPTTQYYTLEQDPEDDDLVANEKDTQSDIESTSDLESMSDLEDDEIFPEEQETARHHIKRIFTLIVQRFKNSFYMTCRNIAKRKSTNSFSHDIGIRKIYQEKMGKDRNRYQSFLYPTRFLTGMLTGMFIAAAMAIGFLTGGIVSFLPKTAGQAQYLFDMCNSRGNGSIFNPMFNTCYLLPPSNYLNSSLIS